MQFVFALVSVIFLYHFFKFIFSGSKKSEIEQKTELSLHLFDEARKTFENPLSSDSISETLKHKIKKSQDKASIFKEEIMRGLFLEFNSFCDDNKIYNLLKKTSTENLPFIKMELNLSRLTNHSLSTKLFCEYLLNNHNKKYNYDNKKGIIINEDLGKTHIIRSFTTQINDNSFLSVMEPEKRAINFDKLLFIDSIDRAFILDVKNDGTPTDIYILSQKRNSFEIKRKTGENSCKIVLKYNYKIDNNGYNPIYTELINYINNNKE